MKNISINGKEINPDEMSEATEELLLDRGGFNIGPIEVRARKNMSGYTEWNASINLDDIYDSNGLGYIDIGDDEGGEISLGEIADMVKQAAIYPDEFVGSSYHKKFIQDAELLGKEIESKHRGI